jgi:hypothetical protein
MDENTLVSANPFEGAVMLQAKIWMKQQMNSVMDKEEWLVINKGQIFYACTSKATHLVKAKLAKMVE